MTKRQTDGEKNRIYRREKYGGETEEIFERIRSYGCCVSGKKHGIHMHHVRSRGAIGRMDERNVVPLNYEYHSEGHTSGWRSFERKYGVNLSELAVYLWEKARKEIEGKKVGGAERLAQRSKRKAGPEKRIEG